MGSTSTSSDASDYTPSADASDSGSSPTLPSIPDADLPSDAEMMKERFAKLLLGEDMSGGGKGVCTALAVSNAITNLSATVFGELWRLEPLKPQKKEMWRREMEWLMSICDSIVELTPTVQDFPGGGVYEVMLPCPRSDLRMNLPALRKLDAMLVGMLDGFCGTEFWYVDRGILFGNMAEEGGSDGCPSSFLRPSVRQEEKWWLPCPRVPAEGLSSEARKRVQQCRDCANQLLKAALAINSAMLAEMAVPQMYLETLPKSGKSCLGDIIYHYITADQFSPEYLLDCLDLSSEHQTLEIANSVEAACHVWRRKARRVLSSDGKVKKSSWSGKVKAFITDASHKSQFLAQRAECLLQSLRIRYPGLPQTLLDMNKIQYNKDVGQAVLESYSRVMESLAFNIIARIDDLIYADDAMKNCASSEAVSLRNRVGLGGLPIIKRISPSPFSIQNSPFSSPFATPRLCSISSDSSPGRGQPSLPRQSFRVQMDAKLTAIVPADAERMRPCTGDLIVGKDCGYL